MYPKTKKIHCVLCNGVIAFDKTNSERFYEHIKFDHEVTEGLDWVVAGSLISVDTRLRVLDVIEKSTPFVRTSKVPVGEKEKEPSEKAIINIELTDEGEEIVEKNTPETPEETEKAANTETNTDKEVEEPPTEAAENVPENVITEKTVEISCKFCPYKSKTRFGLNKHVKKSHPNTPKKAGEDIIKLVQTETDKLIESAKKKTGHYKETSTASEKEVEKETNKASETEKPAEGMTKPNKVYSDVHKMLVEETNTKRRKSLRKSKSETEKLLGEKTDSEPEEKAAGKDSNPEVALEEIQKPKKETRKTSPIKPRDETRETTPIKEETAEPPVKKKRRRTELKSDVQKSVDGSAVEQSPKKILSPSELQEMTDGIARFSNFLTKSINEEKSISDDVQKTSEESDRKRKSKKRKRSLDVEREDEQPEVEAEDLSVVLSRREPEVDLSTCEYFSRKKTMIVNVGNERLQDPSFIEKIHRDENLPPNWFAYIQFFNQGTRRVREFLTPDRRIIRSIDGVKYFLLASSDYTEDDVEIMMSKLSTKSRRSLKREIMD